MTVPSRERTNTSPEPSTSWPSCKTSWGIRQGPTSEPVFSTRCFNASNATLLPLSYHPVIPLYEAQPSDAIAGCWCDPVPAEVVVKAAGCPEMPTRCLVTTLLLSAAAAAAAGFRV